MDEACETQRLLLTARSEALCLRILSTLSERVAAYKREGPGEGKLHSVALPLLLVELLEAYHAQAAGAAKTDGLLKLLKNDIFPAIGDILKALGSLCLNSGEGKRFQIVLKELGLK